MKLLFSFFFLIQIFCEEVLMLIEQLHGPQIGFPPNLYYCLVADTIINVLNDLCCYWPKVIIKIGAYKF